jgi:hypothetical protein
MRSCILVTSWRSNCLALACLQQLLEFARGIEILFIQAGPYGDPKTPAVSGLL